MKMNPSKRKEIIFKIGKASDIDYHSEKSFDSLEDLLNWIKIIPGKRLSEDTEEKGIIIELDEDGTWKIIIYDDYIE